jgi:uncharacterized membrane protein YgaE (UPF0421/DUF939 family)
MWPMIPSLQPLTAAHWKHALKTGLAGALALFLAELAHLPQGYWAAISAVIVMQSEFQSALKASLMRIAGTALGAIVVVPFAELLPGSIPAFGVAVAITILVSFVLRLEESQRLAAATVAIIMLIGRTEPAWLSAIYRFIEVSFGVVISLLIARFVWPAHTQAAESDAH